MLLECILDLFGTHCVAPFDGYLMWHHAEGGEHLAPSLAELAAINKNRVLAGCEQIDDRGFHRAGAGGSEQNDFLFGTEQRLQAFARLI